MGGRRRRSLRRGVMTPVRPNRTVLYLVLFSVLGCLVLSLFVVQALEIRSLRRELRDLNAAQQAALSEQAALRDRLAEGDDLGAIEEEARERLGWVMRGEEKVVFIYEAQEEEA